MTLCDSEGRALVEALAILGEKATLAEAAALAELDEPLSAVDTAVAAGLLNAGGAGGPRLPDPLSRAAVVDLMGLRRAADQHRRASEILTDSVRRLGHRVAATSTTDAELADEVDRLARDHSTEGAWSQAATLFRDAARLTSDEPLREERLIRSVDALVAAGDLLAAGDQVPVVESLRETPLRNAVLAYLAVLRGRATEAQIRLARAWDIVMSNVTRRSALIAQRHVLDSLVRCRGADVVAWADRALQLADTDSPAGIEAAAMRASASSAAASPSARYSGVRRAQHPSAARRPSPAGDHGAWLGAVHPVADLDGARSSLESAVAAAGLGGSNTGPVYVFRLQLHVLLVVWCMASPDGGSQDLSLSIR